MVGKRTVIVANKLTGRVLYTQVLSNVYGDLSSRDAAVIDTIYGAVSGTPEYKVCEIYAYEPGSKSYDTIDKCMTDFKKMHGDIFGEPEWFNAAAYVHI